MLQKDNLTDLTLNMVRSQIGSSEKNKDESVIQFQMVLSQIQSLSNLRRLTVLNLNASLKTNIDILNTGLTRQSNISALTIKFAIPENKTGTLTPIKFPKYLKKLTELNLFGIWHKDFTETMFDIAN